MTTIPIRPRGACSDALAFEVHRRTIAGVRKRIGHQHMHAQAADDAVGEAFIRWLGNPADKSQRLAVEHAHWLIANSIGHLLDTNPNKRRTARAVRSLASWGPSKDSEGDSASAESRHTRKHEAILRKFYDVSEPADYEDNLLGALDATAAKVRGVPATPKTTWRAALDVLIARGWSRAQIAATMAVSYQSVRAWVAGEIVPHSDRRDEILTLAASDASPPAPITAIQASRVTKRAPRPRPEPSRILRPVKRTPALPDESWRDVLFMIESMAARGDSQAEIGRSLGVTRQRISSWVTGEFKPSKVKCAEVMARLSAGAP